MTNKGSSPRRHEDVNKRKSEKEMDLFALYLQKVEALNKQERAVFVEYFSLLVNPVVVCDAGIDFERIMRQGEDHD